ncbi:tripartite tricarboxylate transporter permease [Bacillus thermotolerans]|uniref:Tricarboxylate transport membrane protein TctA n=1 Tax=Bacillus thermotolerans TaxID=1221996 RepID=A0A0F5I6R3_BACTR|nr:tripartite tricarboxylate transporter permease [Bacillus thermotolerans]KKB41211.1 Tricarboxylate transport membrane protein TctA [Bacillus thermotolerans]KKB44073.1 Tricarboxylate transport membrane protein TctA [Bacillus thermotolerans]
MDFSSILYGFQVALSPGNLIFAFIGVLAGTVIGMLPGLGPISAIAIMIPLSYGMDPASALILMAGVYYGAVFGGSTSSILLNAPGVSGTVATSFDGYPMAQQGKAGKALAIAAISSFAGGTISVVFLMLVAPFVADLAVTFGPTEYFALMLLGLTAISSLSDGSTTKAMIAAVVGLMIATVGMDQQTGTSRFTFGNPSLLEGIDFLIVALGLFALAEVCQLILRRKEKESKKKSDVGNLKLSKGELKEMGGPISRHSVLGFILGVLPGAGATIASFLSYISEKRLSKDPSSFGKGNIKGIAAPETSNNAATSGAFVPLLTLGIPGSGTTAVLLGALLVVGVQPGPLMLQDHPDVFWGVIASMYIGNLFLLILNLPLIPFLAKILAIPRQLLISLIIVFCLIGVYAVSFSTFHLYILLGFGVLGFLMRMFSFPAAPFILAFILGGMMEQSFRQAMTISNGSYNVFFQSNITIALFIVSLLSIFVPIISGYFKKKAEANEDERKGRTA